METRQDTLTRRERRELQECLSWWLGPLRVAIFILPIVLVGYLTWRIQSRVSVPGLWWLLPPSALSVLLYHYGRRWTGGRKWRNQIRADLASNSVEVSTVVAVEAIKIEEAEDEGSTYFLKTDDGSTITMSGQYLYPYERRGFPWRVFEIRETARSHFFFGLKRVGERLNPSVVRKSLTWSEMKRLGILSRHWKLIDIPFDELRQHLTSRAGEHATDASQTTSLVSATASQRTLLYSGILTVVFMAFFAFGLYLGFSDNRFVTWGCRLALAFLPLAFLDFASRRYDFGPSLLRYRSWFLWRSIPIPPAIAIRLIPDGKIRIENADNRQLIAELTREFAGGGMLADRLADFYRRHDHKVVVK